LSTDSSTKVKNLNADMVDGLHASAFQLASNTVRVSATLAYGQSRGWEVGPFFTFSASCTDSDGVANFDQMILNNAPGEGYWAESNVKSNNSATETVSEAGGIVSGFDGNVAEEENPPPQSFLDGSSSFVTLIWEDESETINATFYAQDFIAGGCSIEGTFTRST
jgi:hypothetical protein